jgi:hypothetical protein
MVSSHPFTAVSYPCLRSSTLVLARGPHELQVGFDEEPVLVLTDVEADLLRVLRMLDGGHSLHEIRSWSTRLAVSPRTLEWSLHLLHQAGLLLDGAGRDGADRAPVGARLRLVGAGRLGRAVAELLCQSGLTTLYVVDTDPRDPVVYPASGAVATQAEALKHVLGGVQDTRVQVVNHWSKPDGVVPDLTIVASERIECDRVLGEGLVRSDQPHLFIRVRPGGVLVGPLVLPGRTVCLRCTDLTRRDADPAWPTVLQQLCRSRVPVSPVLASWAASVASTQALSLLGGAIPETCGATLEIAAPDYRTRWRSWPLHPGCGCGWGTTAQWGHD